MRVAPYAGAWIEIETRWLFEGVRGVAPYAGAWIEIPALWLDKTEPGSLPTRERGLKSGLGGFLHLPDPVAPYAGAWIEMPDGCIPLAYHRVAPYAGAWIEI